MSSAGDKQVDEERVKLAMSRVTDSLRVLRGLNEQASPIFYTMGSASILELKALRRAFSDDPKNKLESSIIDVWEKNQMKRVADRINRNAPVKADKAILMNPNEEAQALRESRKQLQNFPGLSFSSKPYKRLIRGPLRSKSPHRTEGDRQRKGSQMFLRSRRRVS